MQKYLSLLLASTLAVPFVATADTGRLYYDRGVHVAFDDLGIDSRLGTELQSSYRYFNSDEFDNTSDFAISRARLVLDTRAFSGALKSFISVELSEPEEGEVNDDTLKDAWVEWAALPEANLRLGQYKVPFSRQFLISATDLQMVTRSIATDYFALGRQPGAMVHGEFKNFNYQASASNGLSDGEGENLSGVDTKHLGAVRLSYGSADFDVLQESTLEAREKPQLLFGISSAVGSSDREGEDADALLLGGDLSFRHSNFNIIGEYFFRSDEFKTAEDMEESGFYLQLGQMMVPESWEIASRFSMVFREGGDDITEYSSTVTKFLKGNDLKLQLGISFFETDTAVGRDLTEQEIILLATCVI